MKCQRLLDPIALQKLPLQQHFLQELHRQILASQQQEQRLLVQRRIFERWQQFAGSSFVNEANKFLAAGGAQGIIAGETHPAASSPPAIFRSAMRAAVSAASAGTSPMTAFGNAMRSSASSAWSK